MTQRFAAVAALIVFAVCLLVGGFAAQNSLTTSIERALVAMAATLVIGLVVGSMAQKMLAENANQSGAIAQANPAAGAPPAAAASPTPEQQSAAIPAQSRAGPAPPRTAAPSRKS